LVTAAVTAALLSTPAVLAAEEDEVKIGWHQDGEFGVAWVSGNSNTASINLGYKVRRVWTNSLFSFKFGGVRQSTDEDRYAVGTVDDFVVERPALELDSEILYVTADYNKNITDRFYWNAGVGWDRNTSAGIESRTNIFGGVGNLWFDKDKLVWKTDYGVSYVDQQDEIDDPTTDDSYPALRLASDFMIKFGKSTTYDNDFSYFTNLGDFQDFYFRMVNGLSVSMTEILALKVGLTFLYDNIPSLEEIDLYAPSDLNTPIGTVVTPNEKLDTIFTVSLVINIDPKPK
jgi:putative salt-induced outer membrane protein YdiY